LISPTSQHRHAVRFGGALEDHLVPLGTGAFSRPAKRILSFIKIAYSLQAAIQWSSDVGFASIGD